MLDYYSAGRIGKSSFFAINNFAYLLLNALTVAAFVEIEYDRVTRYYLLRSVNRGGRYES